MKIPPFFILLGTVGVCGTAYFGGQFLGKSAKTVVNTTITQPQISTSYPDKFNLTVNGSTSLVSLNVETKNKFPQATIILKAEGSSKGLTDLINDKADIAAISESLDTNKYPDLQATEVSTDAIAIIVKKDSLLTKLSINQLTGILKGEIKTWKDITGQNTPIDLINKPATSGTWNTIKTKFNLTNQAGRSFSKDGTTDLIKDMKVNSISYTTANQANDSSVKIIKIDNKLPSDFNYTDILKRSLFYVTKKETTNKGVELFVNATRSK